MQKAEEAILWHKKLFGDDYYLELQLHKATVERANQISPSWYFSNSTRSVRGRM